MRVAIGLKIFGIALALLILMAAVALLRIRMTRTVDYQLAIIDQNYFPAYVALATARLATRLRGDLRSVGRKPVTAAR
jgi:hypothetical protein